MPEKQLRVISGGQTGVDTAALKVANEMGIEFSGYCPRGKTNEAGLISRRYSAGLTETNTEAVSERTRKNIENSDGTLIILPHSSHPLTRDGTVLTKQHAENYGKPLLIIHLQENTGAEVIHWINKNRIHALNIAGPRESTSPGIQAAAESFLRELLSLLLNNQHAEQTTPTARRS